MMTQGSSVFVDHHFESLTGSSIAKYYRLVLSLGWSGLLHNGDAQCMVVDLETIVVHYR